jgi:hypothetical protein
LKPEDPSTRASFEQSSSGLPTTSHGHSRRGSQPSLGLQSQPSSSTWRDIRPTMSRGVSDSGRSMYRPGPPFSSMYAQPSVASSATNAMGTMTPMERSSYQVPGSQTQNAYAMQSQMGYGTPSYETYQPPQSQPRSYPGYIPQQQYGQPAPTNYTYSSYQRPTPVPPVPEEGPVGLYGTSSLQLPPILPAPQGQTVKPAMAQQQRQPQPQLQYYPSEQPSEQGSSERPDAKRPRMDIGRILDPRND